MPANYDKIANFYDLLSRLFYGKSLFNAQVSLLKFIPASSHVLIVGGGTGWILEEIAKQHQSGLTIFYIESSRQMINLSKKRHYGNNEVHFINLPAENCMIIADYDIILTPFLFDNFKDDKIQLIFTRLHALLKSKGMWLYADFVPINNKSPLWQKLLLKIMYLFFRITCGIETDKLVSMDGYFANGYEKIFSANFYGQFIQSAAYRKL